MFRRPWSLRLACAHGVELVDEEEDLAVTRLDFLEDGLEPLFELTPVFRAGIETQDFFVLEAWNVTHRNWLRTPR